MNSEKIDIKIILINIRRLCERKFSRTTNKFLVSELLGCGSNSAYEICIQNNIKPDSVSFKEGKE